MSQKPDLQFLASERLTNFIGRRLGKYEVEVGILEDGPEKKWKREQKKLAGGPANKTAGTNKNTTLREVFAKWNLRYQLLLAPWRNANSKEQVQVAKELVNSLNAGGKPTNAMRNAIQAVIRGPIQRGEYGNNSKGWAAIKGFNRLLINTGAMFNAIKARFKNVP